MVPQVVSYLEDLCVRFHVQTLCSSGVMSEKTLLEMRKHGFHHFVKTINNINNVFFNYFQMRYKFAILSPWMIYWFEK